MLTLSELVRDLDVQVLAGHASLDAPVRWVHSTELGDPTPWLSGGELLLTTGMGLETADQQRAYVNRLSDHGLAGLGVGTGFAWEAVPEALVEAAEARAFPLLEVPYDLPFIAVTEKAFARLVNAQYAVLQRSIAAQERLQSIVLSERGLDAIAQAIANLVGATALVFDGRGELLASHAFRRALPEGVLDAITTDLHERARRGDARGFVPAAGDLAAQALALPVSAQASASAPSGLPQAWLVAVKDDGGLEEFHRLVLHQAVTAIALELLRRRVADTTERRLAGDVLAEVVAGEVPGPELARRLEPFGLGGRVSAIVLVADGRRERERCEAALAGALRDEAVSALVAVAGGAAVALMPGFLDPELFELAERVHARVTKALGSEPRTGVGRAVASIEARRAYHEARCALEARALGAEAQVAAGAPHGAVATYRDLGSFQLLLSLQDSDALRLFCESLLGPIEQGEGHYGGELMRSLEAFIEANGQWEAAARKLFCHRHTLRYRIRKVEELTGRDLGSARDRIEFWLALRGRDIAGGGPRQAVFGAPGAAMGTPA